MRKNQTLLRNVIRDCIIIFNRQLNSTQTSEAFASLWQSFDEKFILHRPRIRQNTSAFLFVFTSYFKFSFFACLRPYSKIFITHPQQQQQQKWWPGVDTGTPARPAPPCAGSRPGRERWEQPCGPGSAARWSLRCSRGRTS